MLSYLFRFRGARYLLTGLVCAALNNAILISADFAGLHYLTAILVTVVITLPLSYLVHTAWTFEAPATWRSLARYAAGSVTSLFVASAAVSGFRGGLDLPMIWAAPLATVTMTIFNYVVASWAITRRTPEFTA